MHTSAPYKMPIIETTSHNRHNLVACRRIHRQQRQRKANDPLRAHLQQNSGQDDGAAVGASVCASGSHVWNGNIGTFDRERKEECPEQETCQCVSNCDADASSVGMSNVLAPALKYSARIPNSMITEPTSVYRKNLSRRIAGGRLPHTPIRKYIGTSITSRTCKQKEIERHENTQHAYLEKKEEDVVFLRTNLDSRSTKKESKLRPRSVVRITNSRLMPSMPACSAPRSRESSRGFRELKTRRVRRQAEPPEQRQ